MRWLVPARTEPADLPYCGISSTSSETFPGYAMETSVWVRRQPSANTIPELSLVSKVGLHLHSKLTRKK